MSRKGGTALIIGSSGGFGRVICLELCSLGWNVIGFDLVAAPDDLQVMGNFTDIRVDLTDPVSIESGVRRLDSVELDSVVYAAGVYDHFPLAEAEPDRFERLLAVNLMGLARIVSLTFEQIRRANGRYVIISSETALVSLPFQVYGVSKRMLEVYADALRQELGLIGIPVIIIRPGAHTTSLLHRSRQILSAYRPDSAFRSQLAIVREQGQRVIDAGAADPESIVPVLNEALTSSDPRYIYHLNVATHFKILRLLPKGIVRKLFSRILSTGE